MSDTTDKRNQNAAGTGDGNGNADNGKKENKPNAFVRGFRWVKGKVVSGYEAIKDHPVTHAAMALGGTALGGYAGYKLGTAVATRLSAPEPVQPPILIPETETEDEEETTANPVEYVDIPAKSTEEEGC